MYARVLYFLHIYTNLEHRCQCDARSNLCAKTYVDLFTLSPTHPCGYLVDALFAANYILHVCISTISMYVFQHVSPKTGGLSGGACAVVCNRAAAYEHSPRFTSLIRS
jgi:hypothetical protein